MSLTSKQLARRRAGVGASEIAVLAGLSKWSSPIAVWESKVLGHSIDSNYAMELGTELEAPIARVWAKLNAKHLALVDTLAHPTKPLALATPDRAIYSDAAMRGDARKKRTDVRDAEALLQVKSTNWRMRRLWGDEGTDAVPDEYLCQAHWEGAVAGQSEVIFAVDFDKTKLHEFRVRVDLAVFDALYEIAERFFREHVDTKTPPPPDSSDAWSEYLSRAFPRDAKPALVPIAPGSEPEVERAVAEFLLLKAADARLKKRKEKAYQIIAARIGDAAGIEGTFGKVTWKRTKDSTVVKWQALAEEATKLLLANGFSGEAITSLISQHTTTKPGFRTMRTSPAQHLVFDTGTIDLKLETTTTAALAANNEEENP